MNFRTSSIQSIDLDDLERKLRNFVDPACQNVTLPLTSDYAAATNSPSAVGNRLGGSGGKNLKGVAASVAQPSRTATASSAKLADLDDVERQLREVATSVRRKPSSLATPSSPARKSENARAELAQFVGRDKQPDTPLGAGDRAKPAPSPPANDRDGSRGNVQSGRLGVDQGRFDQRASLGRASHIGASSSASQPGPAQGRRHQADPGVVSDFEDRIIRRFDADARSFLAGAAARLDGIERVAAQPRAAATRSPDERSVVARCARALAVPLLLLAGATGTAVVMLGPVAEAPASKANDTQLNLQAAIPGAGDLAPSQPRAVTSVSPAPSVSSSRLSRSPARTEETADGIAAPAAAPPSERETTQAFATPGTATQPDPVMASDVPIGKVEDKADTLAARVPGDDEARSQSLLHATSSSPAPDQPGVVAEQLHDGVAAPAAASSDQARPAEASPSPAVAIAAGAAAANLSQPARGSQMKASVSGAEPIGGPIAADSAPSMPSLAANLPLPDPVRPSGAGALMGANGQPDAPSSPPPPPTASSAADTPVSGNAPSANKSSAAPTANKPVLTRPAKPSAIIAASHALTMRTVKPLAAVAELKPPADNTDSAESRIGAPLMITPSGLQGPTLEASAGPTQAVEAVEAPSNVRAERAGGPSFSIRLASSLSESDARATLSQLQRQFPGALQGGSVSRDNVGGFGVFYRVRVGPLSREAADKVCSRLKSAGRKCFLVRG